MNSTLINQIDADVMACQNMIAGVDLLLQELPLSLKELVLEFYDTYIMPVGDEIDPPPFIDLFSKQSFRIQEIVHKLHILTTEVSDCMMSSSNQVQAEFYNRKLHFTLNLLINFSLNLSNLFERIAGFDDFYDSLISKSELDRISNLLDSCANKHKMSEEEENEVVPHVKLLTAAVAFNNFYYPLALLPGNVAIIIQLLCDLTGTDVPKLPYFILCEGYVFDQKTEVSRSKSLNNTTEDTHISTDLTHAQIALLYHYNDWTITNNNANVIADKYGQTCGKRLMDYYGALSSPLNRTAKGKYKVRDIKVVLLLLSGEPQQRAEKELYDAKRNNQKTF